MLFYNCHQTGHHKSQCPNPSYCYSCKQTRHIAPKCPNAKVNKGMKLCGFGMPEKLFYSMNIPEEQVEEDKTIRGIVTVFEGRGTKFRIDAKLKYLVDSDWDWQVKRISFDQFMMTIPSVAVMKLLKKMGKIRFTCYDIVASIEETNMSPESFAVLKETWVKTTGIPKIAWNQDPLNKEELKEEIDEEDPDSQDSYGDLAKELMKDGPPPEMKTSSVTPKMGSYGGKANKPLRPAQAQVYSRRGKRSGATMMQIGEARRAQKNLEDSGNPNPNSFSIMQEVDNNILDNVALNCGVILGEEVNSKMDVISLMKAKELAQAAIEQAKLAKKKREELAEAPTSTGREQ
ncbi:hypothetical protein PVAP13_1KG175608, partial [Panicum virgatum]